MNVLCLFAGQGYQEQELFKLFASNQQAQALLWEFSKLTALDFTQPNLPITNPKYSQLIIGIYQFTLFQLLEPLFATHNLNCAGYSLGEVSAFLASSKACVSTAYQVFSYRTKIMTAILKQAPINQYDLLLVRGNFSLAEIKLLCMHYQCFIAISNVKQHLILGGTIANLKTIQAALLQKHTAFSNFLNLSLPAHTPLYLKQKGLLQQFLSSLKLTALHYPILSPINLTKIFDSLKEQELLDQELYTTIQWDKICNLITEYQYDLIIDLGPSQAMTDFLHLTDNQLNVLTLSQYKNIKGVMAAVTNCLKYN